MATTIFSFMARVCAAVGVSIFAVSLVAQTTPRFATDPSVALSQAVGPFVEKNCEMCHDAGLPQGGVDLHGLLALPNSLRERLDTWDEVAYQIRAGQMPPEGAPKPPKSDADTVLELISRAVAAAPRTQSAPAPSKEPITKDWLTFGYDHERTAWDRGETKINKTTAPQLKLLWKLQTDAVPNPVNVYSTMTDPVVANDIATRDGKKKLVYVGSLDNTIYAIDSETGSIYWEKKYPNPQPPPVAPSGNCPENMNATPVIDRDKGILYFLPTDGKLRGIALADGADKFPATTMVPPYSRNFSLNLVDGKIATGTARGCANAASEIVVMDVDNPEHPVTQFYTSPGKGSGPWGRGGIVHTPFGWVAQTADGAFDPLSGRWGDTFVSLTPQGVVTDSFTPPNEEEINARDLEIGSSSPVVFPYGDRTLVAGAGKEGVIYLLDAKNLGGPDHRKALYISPRYSNDIKEFGYNGMWSTMTTYVDGKGKRWLLAPFYGPAAKDTAGQFKKSHGPTVNGELMAFTVEGSSAHPTLVPQWVSADLDLPGVAVVANDVILILASGDRGATLVERPRRAPAAGGGGGQSAAGNSPTQPKLPLGEVNPAEPGFERDQAWRASQLKPFDDGGQQGGHRFSGGRDTTHAVLYAIDPETGDEVYSSGDAVDSWNHYGGIAVADGNVYLTTYDARVFAFGLAKGK